MFDRLQIKAGGSHTTGRRCALLCALLFGIYGAMSSTTSIAVKAAYTNDYIKEKKAAIQDAQTEQQGIKSNITDMKAVKAQLEQSKSDLQSYVSQLNSQLSSIQAKIDTLNNQISDKEAKIEETQAELEEAERVQQEQYDTMKKRIKFLYEKGDKYYIEILLQAGSFSDLLNKTTYIKMLSEYDSNMLEKYKTQTEVVKLTKEELEAEKVTLNDAKESAQTEQANMQTLVAEKQVQMQNMAADINTKEVAIQEYEAQLAAQDATIAALERQVQAEEQRLQKEEEERKAREAAANRRTYSGGQFTWPCPSYSRITSDYGYRTHPIYGVQKFHSGIDMAASSGAAILAAADGVVVGASYDSSMGNYVMIDHGSSLYTVYMHCSALYVSKGQEVSAGQNIAAVGSTGASTGPHLHFSVRLNGQYTSPWPYLGQ